MIFHILLYSTSIVYDSRITLEIILLSDSVIVDKLKCLVHVYLTRSAIIYYFYAIDKFVQFYFNQST